MALLRLRWDFCDTGVIEIGKPNGTNGFFKIRILETDEQL